MTYVHVGIDPHQPKPITDVSPKKNLGEWAGDRLCIMIDAVEDEIGIRSRIRGWSGEARAAEHSAHDVRRAWAKANTSP